mgnify:CR=1 FL=1
MKLVVQIPCYNEEDNIFEAINSIPKKINGINEIVILVLNDGSNDNSEQIINQFDVQYIKTKHVGLAEIFRIGFEYAIKNNADIVVNFDGDNQYKAKDIEKLILPIIKDEADITIGTRPINKIKTFSLTKKILQKMGTFIVKIISNAEIKDATSGFRAYNKKAILKTNIFNNYTYTIENIIQAKSKNLVIKNIDIETNLQINRKSKLVKSNLHYIFKQAINILRFFVIYSPVKFFGFISLFFFLIGIILGFRYLFYFYNHQGTGHIQSLILCSITLMISFILANIMILSDIQSINRKILEDMQEKIRQAK